MAEEFHGGVCGENWPWNSSRNLFASSPCSLATNDIGSFWWPNHDLRAARSSDDSDGGGSVVIQAAPQPLQTTTADSTFQMTGISLSSDDCYQDFLHDSGRSIENYSNFLLDPTMDYQRQTIEEDSWIHSFKQVNQTSTTLQQQQTSTYQSNYFPMDSASYTLLQALFDTDCEPQKSLLDNQAMNYSSNNHQLISSNGFLPETSPMANRSFPTQQPNTSLPLTTNNAPFCHATAASLSNVSSTFLPSSQSHFLPSSLDNKTPNLPIISSKHQHEEDEELASVAKKGSNEAAYKRQRIETPSPLPTFKVRKEKLGDRITALQQLVSPFGKTDTASVLHEAIDYIKFLHDQVNALSTPYLKYGSPPLQRQQGADISTDQEGLINGLKSRGLCLAPISSTFPVVARTPLDLWMPTFGVNHN